MSPLFFDKEIEGSFLDGLAEELQDLQGMSVEYWYRPDNAFRTEGDRADLPAENLPDFAPDAAEVNALYGEAYEITGEDEKGPIVAEDWDFELAGTIQVIVTSTTRDERVDERGNRVVREFEGWVARADADELGFVAVPGDVIQVKAAQDPGFNGFFDVEDASGSTTRFGNEGFHTMYELRLMRRDEFIPERKEIEDV